jgi:uncharacterized protein (TIGR02001 family)
MKKTLPLIAALLTSGLAALSAQAGDYSVTVDFPYATKYVFRGQEIARSALQPSVEVTANSFYAGVWTNTPLVDPHDPTGAARQELDLYGGYNLKLSDSLKLETGLTFYYYPQAVARLTREHTTEASLGLNWTVGGFTPAVFAYYDFSLKNWTVQGSLGYSVPLKNLGASLDLNSAVGYVDPDVGASYTYYSLGLSVPVKLSDAIKFSVGVSYTGNDLKGLKNPGFLGTAGFTLSL